MDQSKKTMRHFYCRDVLWETFEQMANDFDCSIDYLVNEAMRYYARSKNYQSPGGPQVTGGQPVNNTSNASNAPTGYVPPNGANGPSAKPNNRPQPGTQPPPQPSNGPGRRPAVPTPGYNNASGVNTAAQMTNSMPARGGGGGGGGMPGMQHQPQPQSQPVQPQPPQPSGASGPTLFLIYNGQRYPVTKDQFIIGRGSKTSDLPIKDGNISRKHAAVIRRNGTFYIKDLGSTNGIDYKGMRIDNKRIEEGDVFHLCDYELRFTYRAD
jgi:FHA domain